MTTDEDLQGFWDMLLLQVNDIDVKHKEIEWMKANNWEVIKGVCFFLTLKLIE